jgi:predicted DNA-binding WGR domain protein
MSNAIAIKRRFEFVGGGSNKFWEITHNGKAVIVRFGRKGSQGQERTKTFAGKASAQKHADKLVQGKCGKGYIEVA